MHALVTGKACAEHQQCTQEQRNQANADALRNRNPAIQNKCGHITLRADLTRAELPSGLFGRSPDLRIIKT
jgi:hypothetical protein